MPADMHLAIFILICMEVTDGPNECDQAALGSSYHFICYMWYVDAVREECPVLGLLPTRYANDLISQKCDTDTQSSWGLEKQADEEPRCGSDGREWVTY